MAAKWPDSLDACKSLSYGGQSDSIRKLQLIISFFNLGDFGDIFQSSHTSIVDIIQLRWMDDCILHGSDFKDFLVEV